MKEGSVAVNIPVQEPLLLTDEDYGCLTFLIADEHAKGSLQVKLPATGEWISADPIEGCFVCNIGDMMQVYSLRIGINTRFGRIINIDQRYTVSFIRHLDIEFLSRSFSSQTLTLLFLPSKAVSTRMAAKEKSQRKWFMENIF